MGFSTMTFTAKILSWRFRHLNIVGCLLKRRPIKRGSRAPQDTTPPPPPNSNYAPVMETCIPWFIFIIVQVSVSRFITLKLLFKPHVKHSPYSRMFSSSMSPSKALTVVLGSKLLFELTWLIASWKAFHSWLLLLFDNRATRLRK